MKRKNLYQYFRRSLWTGIVHELINYCFMLLCGYLLSELLEFAMASQWQEMSHAGRLAMLALSAALLPNYGLSVLRSNLKLLDTQNFREFLYQCVLNRSIRVEDGGEMNVRMSSDVKTIAKYFQETCPKTISGTAVLLCSTVLISLVDWRIGLIFFALNLTQLLPIIVYEKWTRQIYNQTHSDEETYCNWMLEGCGGIRTIKAYGAEQWYMKRYYALNHAIVNSGKRAEQVGTVETIIFSAIESILNYGSYVIIGLFVLFGGLSIEDAPLLVILAGYLFSSISSIFDLRLQQFDFQEAYNRLEFQDIADPQAGQEYLLKAEYIYKSFGKKPVLNGASCVICSGDRVLLKGDNGSGKSTLLRIFAGLETADRGEMLCGVPKREIAISLQEEPELNITCKELMLAMEENETIDIETMKRHARGFQIESLLSKSLRELSLGERKKFYLSAALAHRGKLLILDEPTNHVDQSGIRYLHRQLLDYPKTLIVCTHASCIDLNWSKTILVDGGICHES